jgi:hypothetical protein
MGHSSGQSDFVFEKPRDPENPENIELPKVADAIMLPKTSRWEHLASATATRWVLGFVFLALVLLVVLTLVGPHIPSGE